MLNQDRIDAAFAEYQAALLAHREASRICHEHHEAYKIADVLQDRAKHRLNGAEWDLQKVILGIEPEILVIPEVPSVSDL